MDDSLRFLVRQVKGRADQLRNVVGGERQRHGDSLIRLVIQTCERIHDEAARAESSLPIANSAQQDVALRELIRLLSDLELVHRVVATFASDIGRTDLPVGLLYLVDQLVENLLAPGTDPILHLSDANMYATTSIADVVPTLTAGVVPPPTVKPVIFMLPGADPTNALLTPILAHEVGHTAWVQGVKADLDARSDLTTATNHLRRAVGGSVPPANLLQIFDSWRTELMCDALATVLTGPSFLFAACVFLPAPRPSVFTDTHPYPRYRLALALSLLEEIGWVPTLERLVPNVLEWCRSLALAVGPPASAAEEAFFDAIKSVESAIKSTATDRVQGALTPAEFQASEEECFHLLRHEIVPAELSGTPTSPWLILCAAWLREVSEADSPESLAEITMDTRLNRFLVKSIELSGISKIWRSS